MWDSGVRKELKCAARAAGCDFPGFGLHSFRRANITMRQEEGASSIEASKIAGHATVNMTGDYTIVQFTRQEALTCAIQKRLGEASAEVARLSLASQRTLSASLQTPVSGARFGHPTVA